MNIKQGFTIKMLIMSLIFSFTILIPGGQAIHAEVDESNDSIVADFANKTFNVTLTDGASIFNHSAEDREAYNNRIIQGQETMNLSLYDRFGGNIKFTPYFGEKKFKIGMADKIYTNIKQNNSEFSIDVMDIFKDSGAQVNNSVYEGRPDIVSGENAEAGFVDPRYSTYSGMSDSGGQAALGNMYLSFASIATEFITYLSGNGIFKDLDKAWEYAIESGVWQQFTELISAFFPIAVILFVVMLLRSIYKMMKGNESIGKILIKVLNFSIALGLVYSLLASPNAVRTITSVVVSATDNMFAKVISSDANEVSKSDDDRYLLHATMWSKIVLDPWSKGMFDGRKYNELYTQFSGDGKKKMPQSNDNILTEWDDGSIRYGSTTLTGDIKVPVGNDKNIQNWAALAWSTQSIYHIDAVNSTSEETEDDTSADDTELEDGDSFHAWPKAERTPKNNQMYVDNFRWLDAKLNISPGYSSVEDNDGNYLKSKTYSVGFVKHGMEAAFLALLLLPTVGPIIRKLVVLVQVITSVVRWIYMSIMSIIRPEDHRYSNLSNLKNVFMPLYVYYWWSMILYIMFFLYLTLAGPMLGNIVWLILAYIIVKFKPVTTSRAVREVQQNIKGVFTNRGRKSS